MEVKRNMLNVFGIVLFTKWWGSLMVKTLVWSQGDENFIPFINIYYVEYICLYMYLLHVCKCIYLGRLWISR